MAAVAATRAGMKMGSPVAYRCHTSSHVQPFSGQAAQLYFTASHLQLRIRDTSEAPREAPPARSCVALRRLRVTHIGSDGRVNWL